MCHVQWISSFLDSSPRPSPMHFFMCPSPSFLQALECLVRLASVRRSIFVEDPSRTQFLSHLMSGTKEILQTGQGITLCPFFAKFCSIVVLLLQISVTWTSGFNCNPLTWSEKPLLCKVKKHLKHELIDSCLVTLCGAL